MSLIQRFLLGNRVDDDLQVGLFLKNDGTVWLRNPDGSETQVSGGGGSGLPSWWTADDTAKTVVVEFPDNPDSGDYFALKSVRPAEFDNYSAFVAASNDESQMMTLDELSLHFTLGDASLRLGLGGVEFNDPTGAAVMAAFINSNADRTSPIAEFYKNDGSGLGGLWGVTKDGLEYFETTGDFAPADSDVGAGQRVQYWDPTTGDPTLRFKERDTAGTLHTGRAASTTADASAFAGLAELDLPTSPTADQIAAALAARGLVTLT